MRARISAVIAKSKTDIGFDYQPLLRKGARAPLAKVQHQERASLTESKYLAVRGKEDGCLVIVRIKVM